MTTTEAEPSAAGTLTIRPGHALLLDQQQPGQYDCLQVEVGLVRVALSRPGQDALDARPVTLGFLQAGDHLPLDALRHDARLHLQALTTTRLVAGCPAQPAIGASSLHDWTLELLLIRQRGEAEQRIVALLHLLVHRLGRRRGAWYELPLRLTHAELAELSGHTRATVTRQFSRWRDHGLLQQDCGPERLLRIAPQLVHA